MIALMSMVALAGATPHPAPPVPATAASAPSRPTPLPPYSAAVAAAPPTPAGRIPGFAAWLANHPTSASPNSWHAIPDRQAWHAIAVAPPGERQAARWDYANSLIATARGAAAIGVLDVMIADDPDLSLVASWQRAYGVAQGQAGHFAEAAAALRQPALFADPEACLWRMQALAAQGSSAAALANGKCALPALNARQPTDRRPFILAAVRAAMAGGQPKAAAVWLDLLSDGDAAANLLRGKLALGHGDGRRARLLLERVNLAGTPEERVDAALSLIDYGLSSRTLSAKLAGQRLDWLLIGWRGDAIERRALFLSMRLGIESHDPERELAAGAALSRYANLGADAQPLVATLRIRLAALLGPGSDLPLARAVGLFWDYRDFAPGGIEGLKLAELLVARLQAAGLYARAADLLEHRLGRITQRDVEQGPLSIRIAGLRILAGDPAAAVSVLRKTQGVPYPEDMVAQRRRLEAVGLNLLGKSREALAVLEDVPDGAALRAEIYWRSQDWARLEAAGAAVLPRGGSQGGSLGEVGQAIVLRQAITSAMLGHGEVLSQLHQRYARAFAGQPTAAAFELLAGNADSLDPAALAKAMAALPSASPVGAIGDMMDAGQLAMTQRK